MSSSHKSGRKRSGTATATRSPPVKEVRDRAQGVGHLKAASASKKSKEGAGGSHDDNGARTNLEDDGFEIVESDDKGEESGNERTVEKKRAKGRKE